MSLQAEYDIEQEYIEHVCIKDLVVEVPAGPQVYKVGDKLSILSHGSAHWIENGKGMMFNDTQMHGHFITVEDYRKSQISTLLD